MSERTQEPIFILSMPRTGSTLLRHLLDAHPEICSAGELRVGAMCEQLESTIETLTYGDETGGRHSREQCFRQVRSILDGIIADYCERKGKPRWCEKTPTNLDYLGVLRATFPDGRYICLQRHGLDVVHSVLEVPALRRSHLAAFMPMHGGHIVASALDWWACGAGRVFGFANTWPDNSLIINYEDLVRETDETMARICSFVNVEVVADLSRLAFEARHDTGRGDHKIAGRKGVRGDGIGRGLSIDLSGVPQSVLAHALALLDRMGYADDV